MSDHLPGTYAPPASVESEQAVLGAVLIDNEVFSLVEETLTGEEFSRLEHVTIFETMAELSEEGLPIDLVMLTTKLQEKDELEAIGGVTYLSELASAVPSAANVKHYIGIVKDKFVSRFAMQSLRAMQHEAGSAPDSAAVIAGIQDMAAKLSDKVSEGKGFRPVGELMRSQFEVFETRYAKRDEGVTGVSTPLKALNDLTGGRQKQDLIIVAARPSVGKTAFELNEAVHAARSGTVKAVGFFSLEMGEVSLMDRVVAMEAHIDGMKLRTGRIHDEDWQKLTMAASFLDGLPLYVDTDPGMTIQQIRSKGRRFKREHGEILLIIDYLQMINCSRKFQNRDAEVGYITQQLKEMAKELDCPVIAISSLGRSVESRADKRPMLSDLRESGQIEFHADEVDFLYRDDYYDKESERANIVEIIVAKGRNTGTGVVEAVYMRNVCKFLNLDRSQYDPPKPREQDDKKDRRRRWA